MKRIIRRTDAATDPSPRAIARDGPNPSSVRTQTVGPPILIRLCRAAGLPEPAAETRFHPLRRWRFDYAWPAHMLALEVEGGIWTQGRHTRGAGALADLEKYSEAAIAGWRILYCTPKDLGTVGLDRVARALRAE